jgi:hypothetical protein
MMATNSETRRIGPGLGASKWKVFGPDLNGRFGSLQGTGGLEAVILDADGTTTGVINDQFGSKRLVSVLLFMSHATG